MPTLPIDPIFISYSRRDTEIMQKIAFFLRDQGFKVWVDNEKLIPGTAAWEEAIEVAIKSACAVIVILSPDSKTSEWVRREVTYSDQFQKRVFPVLVKGTEEASLPLRLVTRQYVDLRKDEEAGLTALLAAIMFFIEQKKTQEMKRPVIEKAVTGEPISSHVFTTPAPAKDKKPAKLWMLSAGALMAFCVLGSAIVWAGYRLFSPLVPVTGPDSFDSTSAADPPTEILTEAPLEAATDIPVDAGIPTEAPAPVSAPDMLSNYFEEYQVIHADPFDDPSGSSWDVQSGEIENGVMEIVGNDNYDGAWYTEEIPENNAILLDFSFSDDSTFLVYLNFASFGTDAFRRFGIYVENGSTPITDLYNPDYLWGGYSGGLATEPGKTYKVLLAALPGGEILNVVWDPEDPDSMLEYRNQFDETWAGLPWTLVIQAQKGTIVFDNFQVVEVGGVR